MKLPVKSIRLRLTLWYAAVLTALILLFSGILYRFVDVRLKHLMKEDLETDLENVEKVVREGPEEIREYSANFSAQLFQVTHPSMGIFPSAGWLHEDLNHVMRTHIVGRSIVKISTREEPFFVLKKTIRYSDQAWIIEVARDAEHVDQILSMLKVYILFSIPLSLILAGCGGYFLARKMLAPIGFMAAKAKEITAECLEERLPVANPDDEIGQMATVFNETLQRLHASFESLRRFTSDASHELRTPLTAIRTVGEVSLRKPLSAADYRDVIGSMLEEAERLALLVENLLTLTRVDHGRVSMKREPVSIDKLVKDAVNDLSVLAEEKEQSLFVEPSAAITVSADRCSIRQALVNLLDNAIKYTPEKGRIRVRTEINGRSEAVIEVIDNGTGVPRDQLEKIFERFYRVDKGRSRETGGTGLGLSIARQAVEANGGRIEVESRKNHGSTFRIVFPMKDEGKIKR